MKIALINTIKPQPGSGDGMTEYTYQIYNKIKEKHDVDLVYELDKAKRNDVLGNVSVHSLFKLKIARLAKKNYDIIHITNQEAGFAAKILKRSKTKAKIITSIHDLMRYKESKETGFHKGIMQGIYSHLITSSIEDCIKYSDMIIFSASTVEKDSKKKFPKMKKWKTTLLCPKEDFRTAPIKMKRKGKILNVGFIGALAFRKNAIFILRTANLLKNDKRIKFTVWGKGAEYQNLLAFKEQNGLNNVSFPGFAPEKEIMKIYDGFDIFFYPSLEEGSSLPILDAQARGLPVIVYSKNNMDIEVTKMSVPARNPEHAAKILKEISRKGYSAKKIKELTEYARSFSWQRVANETLDAYRELLNAKG